LASSTKRDQRLRRNLGAKHCDAGKQLMLHVHHDIFQIVPCPKPHLQFILVGGAITILKNDGVRQWGWDDIPYMKWKSNQIPWFQTTNQYKASVLLVEQVRIDFHMPRAAHGIPRTAPNCSWQ